MTGGLEACRLRRPVGKATPARLAALRTTARLRWARSASGQAMLEFALILIPVVVLIMGGVDFGFLWSDVDGMRQGVGSAARQAAVGEFGGDSSCVLTGGSFSGNTRLLACLVHDADGIGDDARTRVKIVVGDAAQATPSYQPNHPITICEQYMTRDLSGLLPFIGGHIATARTTIMVEPGTPANAVTSTQETSIDGNSSSWNFCTTPSGP